MYILYFLCSQLFMYFYKQSIMIRILHNYTVEDFNPSLQIYILRRQ
jgi:hypothetical protein